MPKIIGGSLHEHREQTRLKLFGALSRLMAERGFDAITLADIAQAAGVGRTAVYNHFADKESMLVGFIMHETAQYVAALEAELAGVDDPTDQLRAYVRAQCVLKRDYHLAPGPDLRSVLSRSTQQRVREHVVMVEAMLRRILAAGIESASSRAGPRHHGVPGQRVPQQPRPAGGGPRPGPGHRVDRAVRAARRRRGRPRPRTRARGRPRLIHPHQDGPFTRTAAPVRCAACGRGPDGR